MTNKLKNLFKIRISRIDYFIQTSFFTGIYLYLCAIFTPESLEATFSKANLPDFLLLAGYLTTMAYPAVGRLHDIGRSADYFVSFCVTCLLSLAMHSFISTTDPGDSYNMLVMLVDMVVSCGFFVFLIYLLIASPQNKANQFGEPPK